MKVAIIGAGNMGGAIAKGLAQGSIIAAKDICVSNPSQGKLDALKASFPELNTTHDNRLAAQEADMVIVAVKPWFVEGVLKEMQLRKDQLLVSVAAGISFEQLSAFAGCDDMTMFRLIPNTAISLLQSTTIIASCHASQEQEQLMLNIFNEMGLSVLVPEDKMAACTSLTSCGIAYVLKYIQAAIQAGIELGVRPKDASQMVAQSVKGAAELILQNGSHPASEIEKVCTPGGLTIKGINQLEHDGFTSAIIHAMKASMK
ncbi:MAG: pyrroline-5-carboxylate reductase [Bacteroidaceae bacterium]|nr:pyrroline-5-carboxylate reductase [Bacteroidaceae bacterium]